MVLSRDEVRDVGHAGAGCHHGFVGAVLRCAVEVAANESDGWGELAGAGPLVGELDEEFGAVLAGFHADVVEMGAHDHDSCARDTVGELAHGHDTVEDSIPSNGWHVGRLAQPAYLAALTRPRVGAVEDGGEFALGWVLVPAPADVRPGRAEAFLDLIDLVVEGLLEAEEGALVACSDEPELRAELGPADGPGPLARYWLLCVVPDIVRDKPQWQLRTLHMEVQHARRCVALWLNDLALAHGVRFSEKDLGGVSAPRVRGAGMALRVSGKPGHDEAEDEAGGEDEAE